MLELHGLTKHFGGVRAVDGIDLTVPDGFVFGLIGPNGSGKSTTVNLIGGVFPPTRGSAKLGGVEITQLAAHVRVAKGLARTFQNIRLFGQLPVWKNLWVAQRSGRAAGRGWISHSLGGAPAKTPSIDELLVLSGLEHRRNDLAMNLSFGEQRRLELARAMATGPKVLMLDEPAAGMNSEEITDLDTRIRALKARGLTMLLIEHHMELVMAVCDRIAVLNFGQKIAEGTPSEIQADKAVRAAYLGDAQT